jgi:hypothetical protein
MVAEHTRREMEPKITAVGHLRGEGLVRIAEEQIGQWYIDTVLLEDRLERGVDRTWHRDAGVHVLRAVVERQTPAIEPDRSAERVAFRIGGQLIGPLNRDPAHVGEQGARLAARDFIEAFLGLEREGFRRGQERGHGTEHFVRTRIENAGWRIWIGDRLDDRRRGATRI